VQVDALRERQRAQRDLAAPEQLADLLAVVGRVVVGTPCGLGADAVQHFAQVLHQLVLVVRHHRRGLARLVARHVDDVEEQHRGVGDRRAARLGHDHRVRDLAGPERAHDRLDHVGAVLVERIVLAVVGIGLRAVVVHAEPAARSRYPSAAPSFFSAT
jgi:hypothetical protein